MYYLLSKAFGDVDPKSIERVHEITSRMSSLMSDIKKLGVVQTELTSHNSEEPADQIECSQTCK